MEGKRGCGRGAHSLLGGVPTFRPLPLPLLPGPASPLQADGPRRPGTLTQCALSAARTAASSSIASSCSVLWPPTPLPAADPIPHLPTPCRSLSVLRQGAMAGLRGPRALHVLLRGSSQGVARLCRAPLPSSFQTPSQGPPPLLGSPCFSSSLLMIRDIFEG